jgi:hypothetical protein
MRAAAARAGSVGVAVGGVKVWWWWARDGGVGTTLSEGLNAAMRLALEADQAARAEGPFVTPSSKRCTLYWTGTGGSGE